MSRTLKRVPPTFSWPLGKVWVGYINPHYKATPCPHCENGFSSEYTKRYKQWYSHLDGGFRPEMRGSTPYKPDDELVKRIIQGKLARSSGWDISIYQESVRMCEIWNSSWCNHLNKQDVEALIEAGRLMDFTHTWTQGSGWQRKAPGYRPTPKEVNDWSLSGFGHDAQNAWIVIKAELKRLNLPDTCDKCDGSAEVWENEADRAAYVSWEEYEPPTGDGYQLWETTSEDSPSSPVFSTLEDLCNWCETGTTTFGSARATAAEWREMLEAEYVHHTIGNVTFI